MRPALTLAAAALALAACSSNGGGDAQPDEASTVSIITTTTTAPAATSDGQSGTSEPTETTRTTTSPEDVTSTSESATTVVATAPTTTSTTSAPPRVGEPVVSSEPVGEFRSPVDLAVRPGDQHWYVVEQSGAVVRFDGTDSVTVLDLGGRVSGGNEQGLLGLAFSPDGGRAYVNYTDQSGDTIIAEYPVGPDGAFDAASERIVLAVDQPFSNHNAGDLEFGPDGMLYIPLGDGGSGGDPERYGNDSFTLLGSLLRIDPMPVGDAPYTVPPDNPFADGADGAPEVWSIGLRNPWKIAFDPVTGDLWIPDVGQNRFEEINVVGPGDGFTAGRGADFGWSAFEGTERFNADVPDPGDLTWPVLTYGRADGCSISGGVPYRGSAIPELEPAFVYSDFCSSSIRALDLAGGRNLVLLGGFDGITAVRTGPDGELYVLERGGTMHRLIAG